MDGNVSIPAALTTIRPELLSLSAEQLMALGPWVLALGGALVLMLAAAAMKRWKGVVPFFFVLIAGATAWSATRLVGGGEVLLFNRMMVVDRLTLVMTVLFSVAGLVSALSSMRYLDREGLQHPEYYILMLFSMIGMMSMVSALDLIVIFVALELMSISVYVLVGFRRADRRANEAAVKYFVLGGAASAVYLYGSALLYGATGSIQIQDILSWVQGAGQQPSLLFVLGSVLVLFGFLFKVASFPFHMWMPDVYEGAPAPITGFMTTGIKAASFATLIRVVSGVGYGAGLVESVQRHLHDLLWISAALTMVVGNVVALTQIQLKRMLAYSSIAHTGYLLVGILTAPFSADGYGPVVMYLVTYTVMNLGAFAVLTALAKRADSGLNLHDLAGLSRKHPFLAFAMAAFIFSMAGIPPTAGFAAKYLVFSNAVQAGEIWLTVIAVLCSAISVYYYLRVLVFMYMREPAEAGVGIVQSKRLLAALLVMLVLTIELGVFPAPLMRLARTLARSTPARVVQVGMTEVEAQK
ncbi:MAG: hypothetical protein RJB38_927 [Pseudomonadota bacterium]|jgi:NADH-quinone oxidoreductase subunit N